MTDAPRLTDERIRRLAYGDLPRVNEVRSMADELQERRAQQSEGAQAKAVEALQQLFKAAEKVSRYGAVTGPQWTHLGSALIAARAALPPPHRQTEEKG